MPIGAKQTSSSVESRREVLTRGDNPDAFVLSDYEDILISGHDEFGLGAHCTLEKYVIFGFPATLIAPQLCLKLIRR